MTRIENPYGHYMTILYHAGLPTIDKITDSLGREVDFITSGTTNPKLDKIQVKNAHGTTVDYDYTVGDFAVGDYYQLQQYDPPELAASTYEYLDGGNFQFEMTAVNTSFGGRMQYEYGSQTFYYQVYSLETRVLKEKNIRFSPTLPFKTWIYTYPTYQNAETGTVSTDGPEFDSSVTYLAYTASTPWKVGLIKTRTLADGSYSEDYAWDSYVISNIHWFVLSIDMGPVTAPLLSTLDKTRKGDAESKEEYLYERASVKKYGLPTRVNFYANDSLRNYRTLDHYFETSTAYEDRYMLSFIWKEKEYTSGGTLLKEIQTTYYSTTGKFGAIDLIKRWKSGSTYLSWDYTYSSTNPNLITITVDLPGSAGTETYEYRYGVLSKIERPGYTELSRTISQYDSSILSETNQHGGVMNFTYDGLGRITNIDMPSGFNDVGASWAANSVTITQGANTLIEYWDGLGRDTGYEESGDGITLCYRKTLDAEGRLTAESKGSTDSTDIYSYELTALGQVKKITDPRGKITNISYSGDVKTVTDPEGRVTAHEYAGLPGLVTKLTDAQSRIANHTYDAIGRLAQAVYNSARTQSYSYDGLDNITSETHPETGTISHAYNYENNLSLKSWGGTQLNYAYNSSNQLTTLNAADETITYEYDTYGRIKKISGTKGWNRDLITYNSLGSVNGESQDIPGLATKTTSYAYDGNNNLREITYPDGKKVTYTNNGLNMPETATFYTQSIVSAVSYGYGKQPTSITISGNGTSFSASYNDAGALSSASLKKGATTLYAATYSYDGLGNITSISNTTPQLNGAFGYDSLYRLTSAGYTPSGTGRVNNFTYTYDEYGNMTTVKENATTVFNKTYNSQNQISGFTYDSRGNLTADGSYQYIWDNQNRLQELKNPSGITLGTYLYNERGLRLRSVAVSTSHSIFSFDGKLLAQYEIGSSGQTNRDYIYVGDRLVAEYRPLESKYYYYTPDQINSVRMITNNTGTVVYSATYDPYGGIEKTWVSSYSPKLKFSGKERDSESGMDYFAARYYNRTQYRFNSPDPVIAREDPISNPQLWNLYAYCRNSPINHLDLSGRYGIDVHYYMTYYLAKQAGFSPSEAAVIARANQSVDRSPATSPMRFWRKGFSESLGSWHFAQEEKVNQLIVEAYKSGDLHELGRALHVLQDSLYAHLGYKVPFGHVWDTLTGKNPDLTYRDVEKALRMAQHTLDILIGFRGTEGKRINEEFLRSYFQTPNKEDKIKMINQQ